MNRNLKIYTEIRGLYDYRRGILQWMMTEGITDDVLRTREGDRLWNLHIASNYKDRRMDTFEYPHLGINKAKFDAVDKQYKLEHWLMFYPTNMGKQLFRRVIELEQLIEKPIDIKGVTLYVNTWPYQFDDEMKELLQKTLDHLFGGRFEVVLQDMDVTNAEPFFYKQYNYVFKYDIMDEPYKKFQSLVGQQPVPDTTFVVPDILMREVEGFTGSVAERIFAYSLSISTVFKMIPISHDFYDAAEVVPE